MMSRRVFGQCGPALFRCRHPAAWDAGGVSRGLGDELLVQGWSRVVQVLVQGDALVSR